MAGKAASAARLISAKSIGPFIERPSRRLASVAWTRVKAIDRHGELPGEPNGRRIGFPVRLADALI